MLVASLAAQPQPCAVRHPFAYTWRRDARTSFRCVECSRDNAQVRIIQIIITRNFWFSARPKTPRARANFPSRWAFIRQRHGKRAPNEELFSSNKWSATGAQPKKINAPGAPTHKKNAARRKISSFNGKYISGAVVANKHVNYPELAAGRAPRNDFAPGAPRRRIM